MVINTISGTPQLIFANERVRLARVNDNGHLSYAAYVHRTKTTHQFISAKSMLKFTEEMGLISANHTLRRAEIKERLQPFVIQKWNERCKAGMSFKEARLAIQKGHTLTQGEGLMKETTWTEFDAEMDFLAPKGIFLDLLPHVYGKDSDTQIHMHKRGCGWVYEILDEILIDLVSINGGDPTVTLDDYDW